MKKVLSFFATYRIGTILVLILYIWLWASHRMSHELLFSQHFLAVIVGALTGQLVLSMSSRKRLG